MPGEEFDWISNRVEEVFFWMWHGILVDRGW